MTLFQPVLSDEEDESNSVEPPLIADSSRSSRFRFPDDPFLFDLFDK